MAWPKTPFYVSGLLSSVVSAVKKTLLLQAGDPLTGTVDCDEVEHWQPPGLASLPSGPSPSPTPGQGAVTCQGLIYRNSGRDQCIGTRDSRCQGIYGNLKPGETCLYAGGAQGAGTGRVLLKANGDVWIFTNLANSPTGQNVMFRIGADGTLNFRSPLGTAIVCDADGSIKITNGKGGLVIDAAGNVKLTGTAVAVQATAVAVVSGAIMTCLGPKSVPTPGTPGPTSALVGLSGQAGAPSSNVFISPTP